MKNCMLFLLVCLTLHVQAQDTSKQHPFSIHIDMTSVPVQQVAGTDTSFSNAFSVSPVLELRAKSGWGITYAPSIVSSRSTSGVYMHTFSAGYEKYGSGHFDVAFNYSHFFFTQTTAVPYSPLTNELSLFINYTHSWLRPLVSVSAGFGRDSSTTGNVHDIGLAAGVNHSFSWDDKGVFNSIELTPGVLVNAGTNGYFSFLATNKYLSHSNRFAKLVKKASKGGLTRGRGNTKPAASTSPFTVSNAQGSLEGSLEMGAFTIRPSASVFFPVGSGADNKPFGYGEIVFQYRF